MQAIFAFILLSLIIRSGYVIFIYLSYKKNQRKFIEKLNIFSIDKFDSKIKISELKNPLYLFFRFDIWNKLSFFDIQNFQRIYDYSVNKNGNDFTQYKLHQRLMYFIENTLNYEPLNQVGETDIKFPLNWYWKRNISDSKSIMFILNRDYFKFGNISTDNEKKPIYEKNDKTFKIINLVDKWKGNQEVYDKFLLETLKPFFSDLSSEYNITIGITDTFDIDKFDLNKITIYQGNIEKSQNTILEKRD